MSIKLRIATILIGVFSLGFPVSALAQEGDTGESFRVAGEVIEINVNSGSFEVDTLRGDRKRIWTDSDTRYRSRGGEVDELEDLQPGMEVLVMGMKAGEGRWEAEVVIAGHLSAGEGRLRVIGEIVDVEVGAMAFSLKRPEAETLRIEVTEATRYRSPQGEVEGVEDLEIGMRALVVARQPEEGNPIALLVAAGHPEDLPDLSRYKGEISQVIPGQQTFSLVTLGGEDISLLTNERTRFLSRDGSVESIHDLKKGMKAHVAAVETEEGLIAVVVAAGNPERKPELDKRAVGRITGVGEDSFTLHTRSGEDLSIRVDSSTRYFSRGGEVNGLGDLEVGMVAAVGSVKEGGGYLARWVAAGHPPPDRGPASPEDRPLREPAVPGKPEKLP